MRFTGGGIRLEEITPTIWQYVLLAIPTIAAVVYALWLFFSKIVFPFWQRERETQRAHDRQMAAQEQVDLETQRQHERDMRKAQSAAEESGDVALWGQMVTMQTEVMKQNALLLEFLIQLATDTMGKMDSDIQTELREIAQKWSLAGEGTRQLQAAVGLLTSDISEHGKQTELIQNLPAILLELVNNQSAFYQRTEDLFTRMLLARPDQVKEAKNDK